MVKCLKRKNYNVEDSSLPIIGPIFKQRQSEVGLELVGKRCFIHNGLTLVPIRVVKQMVGFRFCSFIPIRTRIVRLGVSGKRKNK